LLGRTVGWRSQGREEITTTLREALRHHGLDSLFASAWGAGLFWLSPGYFWWVTPVIGALILSLPLSVYTSRASLGERAARQALLERALAEGPASLTGRERRILLGDPDLTDALHRRVWALPDHERAARWGRPGLAPHPGPPPPSP